MSLTSNKHPRVDLHGYHPIVVDETMPTDKDGLEFAEEQTRIRVNQLPAPDWRSHLTPEELSDYEAWTRRPSYRIENSNAQTEADGLIRTGERRGYARRKYNGGRSHWYGDGPPPWLQAKG